MLPRFFYERLGVLVFEQEHSSITLLVIFIVCSGFIQICYELPV